MFSMRFDRRHELLHIRIGEIWLPPAIPDFVDAVVAKLIKIGATRGRLTILNDWRDLEYVTMELLDAWSQILGRDFAFIHCPYAVVVNSLPIMHYTKLALTAPNVAVFYDVAEAKAWLLSRQQLAT